MTQQPTALQLADALDKSVLAVNAEAAAELRRLHEAHDWQYKMAGERLRRIEKLEAALRQAVEALDCIYSPLHVREINKVGAAMAAAKQALGEQV